MERTLMAQGQLELLPLQQALEEPPYENHDSRPRPDIARLIEEEEAMLRHR